jgi:hypothetical protein
VLKNSLPVSALPFTLRSSSLQPGSTQSYQTMAGKGLYASRYASTNPIGSAQARQLSIKDRLAALKSAKPIAEKEQAAHQAALSLAADEAHAKQVGERRVAEQANLAIEAKGHGTERAAEEAEVRRREAERLVKQEEARRSEAERMSKEKEVQRVEAQRIAREKDDARRKIEADMKEKTEHDRLAKEKADAQAKKYEVAKQEFAQVKTKLQGTTKAEVARKIARELAGMTALEELSRADARVKEATKDKAELSKLVDETTGELAVVQHRLDNLQKKSVELDDQISEAQRAADDANKRINTIESDSKIKRATYEKERDELVKKLEAIKKSVASIVPIKVSPHTVSVQFSCMLMLSDK